MLAIIDNPKGGYDTALIRDYINPLVIIKHFDTLEDAMKSKPKAEWIDPPKDEDFSGDIVKISYKF
jgi:hypothetical protein